MTDRSEASKKMKGDDAITSTNAAPPPTVPHFVTPTAATVTSFPSTPQKTTDKPSSSASSVSPRQKSPSLAATYIGHLAFQNSDKTWQTEEMVHVWGESKLTAIDPTSRLRPAKLVANMPVGVTCCEIGGKMMVNNLRAMRSNPELESANKNIGAHEPGDIDIKAESVSESLALRVVLGVITGEPYKRDLPSKTNEGRIHHRTELPVAVPDTTGDLKDTTVFFWNDLPDDKAKYALGKVIAVYGVYHPDYADETGFMTRKTSYVDWDIDTQQARALRTKYVERQREDAAKQAVLEAPPGFDFV